MLGLGDVIRKGSSLRAPEPEGVSSYSCKDVGADGRTGGAWHGTRAPSSAFPLQNPLYSSSSFALEPRASLSLSLFVGSFSISFSEGMQIFGP